MLPASDPEEREDCKNIAYPDILEAKNISQNITKIKLFAVFTCIIIAANSPLVHPHGHPLLVNTSMWKVTLLAVKQKCFHP